MSEWNDHQNEPALQPTDKDLTVTTGQRLTVDPGSPTAEEPKGPAEEHADQLDAASDRHIEEQGGAREVLNTQESADERNDQ